MYLTVTADADGRLTLPAFAARGMDCAPGETVKIKLNLAADTGEDGKPPSEQAARVRGEYGADGYTVSGGVINLPIKLLNDAGIPLGNEISVLSSDGVLIVAAANGGRQRDLTDELGCFMAELGCDPECVETVEVTLPF
jgi:hypothetical protein